MSKWVMKIEIAIEIAISLQSKFDDQCGRLAPMAGNILFLKRLDGCLRWRFKKR